MRKQSIIFVIILIFTVKAALPLSEFIVDNDAGAPDFITSGTWNVSSSPGYNGGTYVFALDPDYPDEDYPPGGARWIPDIPESGVYEVFAIYRQSSNRTEDAPYTIKHADDTDIVHISQNGGNSIVEKLLGEFRFNAGRESWIQLDNNGGSGAYIADALRFAPPVDDPPVISDVNHDPIFPDPGEEVTVTAKITDDYGVNIADLFYKQASDAHFKGLRMNDKGELPDEIAGDGIYSGNIPSFEMDAEVTYFVRGYDENLQMNESPETTYTVGYVPPPEYRCIWADTWNASILTPGQVDDLVQTCRENNINCIIPEIRKVGDAYYNSNLEPRANNIYGGEEFDPLGYLLEKAHDTSDGKHYIEVHGWFVMQRISTSETVPAGHVLDVHPEYLMITSTGESGPPLFLDPGHPDAVDHNVAVIVDCLQNYDMDGVNLDYIRYPEYPGEWGYNPVSVSRFNEIYGKSGEPSPDDPDWDAWRRECVSLQVKKVYVKSRMVKPDIILTPDTVQWGSTWDDFENSRAYTDVFQNWVEWLHEGIIDYNNLMNYAANNIHFNGWMDVSLSNDDKRGSIIGIGAYQQPSVQESMNKLLRIRENGADGMNIYDWGSEVNSSSSTRDEFYRQLKSQVFPTWVNPPEADWRTSPTLGIFEGKLTDRGAPVDHGTVMIEGMPETETVTDGSGWYAILDVTGGEHTLIFTSRGGRSVSVETKMPEYGEIITINADLGMGACGWLYR